MFMARLQAPIFAKRDVMTIMNEKKSNGIFDLDKKQSWDEKIDK